MADINTEQIIIGTLMKDTSFLTQTDKYTLSIDDFDDKLLQYIFYAIANITQEGSDSIEVQDIDLFLKDSSVAQGLFTSRNGIALLGDVIQLANPSSFNTYYNLLKKENLLRDLTKIGIDTSKFYEKNPITQEEIRINDKYLELSLSDIINEIKSDILSLEEGYLKEDATETISAADGLDDLLENLADGSEIGVPIQGDIFNTVTAGARKGTFYVRSGASGVSKTRQAVGDSCFLAYPVRYNLKTCKWEQKGHSEKVLFIATEQNFKEIQKMILAYLSGINEARFKYNDFTERERKVLHQAKKVMEEYSENMYIVRMPNPSIEIVKTIVRSSVLKHQVEYVFYDYIFISPSLLKEFKDFRLRNDEVLLLFSTALKDLAVELDIFMMTSTQLNAKGDDNKNIKNEGSIAGSRAIVNKADVGCIMSRVTYEELEQLSFLMEGVNFVKPNIVTDIYKIRAGEWNQVRIWSHVDLGNLRKQDIFITDSRMEPIEGFEIKNINYDDGALEKYGEMLVELNKK